MGTSLLFIVYRLLPFQSYLPLFNSLQVSEFPPGQHGALGATEQLLSDPFFIVCCVFEPVWLLASWGQETAFKRKKVYWPGTVWFCWISPSAYFHWPFESILKDSPIKEKVIRLSAV